MRNIVMCLRSDAQSTKTVSPVLHASIGNGTAALPRVVHRYAVVSLTLLILLSGCAQRPVAPVIDRDPVDTPSDPEVMEPGYPKANSAAVVQARLEKFSRVWEGVRYRLGGDDERGIDCSALSARIYKDLFSHNLPRTTTAQLKAGRRVHLDEIAPGDLVFFKLPGGDKHVGVFVGNDRFVHASLSRGVMTSSLRSPYWRQYYLAATRPATADKLAH